MKEFNLEEALAGYPVIMYWMKPTSRTLISSSILGSVLHYDDGQCMFNPDKKILNPYDLFIESIQKWIMRAYASKFDDIISIESNVFGRVN